MPSNGKAADHRVSVLDEEYALFCWLKLHPDVCKTYGMKNVHKDTRIGEMLLATLQAQGMSVDWYSQVPRRHPPTPRVAATVETGSNPA